ncbi:hypothetical protein BDV96DRAFT_639844 [Lophiotrema nucula]|uniref:BTB domain-containing protein n=1 Tax=Lophiotrema nucula TaxID=690887 RepID=A0A6A5ZSC0_9PLEO|nr:hypothetical protein BDV96DRAFT_639844 [Lophiotrema nucula]
MDVDTDFEVEIGCGCNPNLPIDLQSPVIKVLVGLGRDLKKPFLVHQNALVQTSAFFKKAMQPNWAAMRPDPDTVALEEDEPSIFLYYAAWLYSKELSVDTEPECRSCLANCYVLGESLLDVDFKNAVIDAMIDHQDYPAFSYKVVNIVYGGTPKNSPARRLLVSMWANRAHAVGWKDDFEHCPKDFLISLLQAMVTVRPYINEEPWKENRKDYHEYKSRYDWEPRTRGNIGVPTQPFFFFTITGGAFDSFWLALSGQLCRSSIFRFGYQWSFSGVWVLRPASSEGAHTKR